MRRSTQLAPAPWELPSAPPCRSPSSCKGFLQQAGHVSCARSNHTCRSRGSRLVPKTVQSTSTEPGAASSSDHTSASKGRGQNAVVIGAGPAGTCAAMYLARRGYQVDVYERRAPPEVDQVDRDRSYIICLSQRGIHALRNIGVNLPSGEADYLGTVMHRFNGKTSVGKASGNISLERVELVQLLISEAKRMYPRNITFHFNSPCEGWNLGAREAHLATPYGDSSKAQYDVLLAADGASSQLRNLLSAELPGFSVTSQDSGRQYKTFRGLQADLEPPEYQGRPGRSLHLFLGSNSLTSLSAHKNADGSYSGTLGLKRGAFDTLHEAKEYEHIMNTAIKGVPEHWIPAIAQQCLYAPIQNTGKRVQCSQLHAAPGVLLLGDAAHADAENILWAAGLQAMSTVTPVIGQGCNSALEDCEVLDSVLEATGDNIEAAAEAWTRRRLPDAVSLSTIEGAVYRLVGGRKLGFLDPTFLSIIAHLALGTIRNKLLPFMFGPPALSKIDSTIPYSEIESSIRRDASLTLALVLSAVVYAGLKLCRVV